MSPKHRSPPYSIASLISCVPNLPFEWVRTMDTMLMKRREAISSKDFHFMISIEFQLINYKPTVSHLQERKNDVLEHANKFHISCGDMLNYSGVHRGQFVHVENYESMRW